MTMTDIDVEHRQGEAEFDEFPYSYRCASCHQPWPCQAIEAQRTARPARAVVPHEQSDGSCVGCGFPWPCPVAARRRSLADLEERIRSLATYGCHLEAFDGNEWKATRGGMVIAHTDDADGRRTFTVMNWYRGAGPYSVDVALADVEPASVALPRLDLMRDAARSIGRWVGQQAGAAGGDEVRWLRVATDLMEAAT